MRTSARKETWVLAVPLGLRIAFALGAFLWVLAVLVCPRLLLVALLPT